MAFGMVRETIDKVYVTDAGELFLSLEGDGKPMYQYVYQEAAGVYWDQENHGFKSTPMKEMSCSEWFSHIVGVTKSGLGIELVLSPDASWQGIPENDLTTIVRDHAI